MVLGKALESPLNSKEIKPINPKGNQPWIFIGRTDAETEAPILWPPNVKSRLIGKDPDAGKDWRQEEKGTTEDKVVGWHHRFSGHEFEQSLGDSEGQRSVLQSMGSQRVGWLSDWTTAATLYPSNYLSCNWKFIPFTTFIQYPLPLSLPLITTNLVSFFFLLWACLKYNWPIPGAQYHDFIFLYRI